ncbi:dephospho-CoA kinase [Legionella shakespearei]|uniref:Dephospho-CoA kinase n=1 Tax=Legionella shakespearei DSM 23087 TaxID=1122169 RepID=A0A0W0YWE6_9GAMM|nr:dephospho-CoA kinase [Legionella shakespearei]KTD60958.1 dephospho-CoA kinase [Legionella shakespearei DSM 23087]
MVFSVGLTGNIASGKSTVATIFAELGIHVINADQISRDLTVMGSPVLREIVNHFGSSVLSEDGTLNRKYLRELIFSHSEERAWLEQLLHPLIRKQLEEQIKNCTSAYCILEIALLTDKTNYPYLDKILLVTAPEDVQIARVMQRDHCTKEQALAILSSQPDLATRLNSADDTLVNDSGFEELKYKVEQLHQNYLAEARLKNRGAY